MTLTEIILGIRRPRRFLASLRRAEARVLGWFGDYPNFDELYEAVVAPHWPTLSKDHVFRRRLEAVHQREVEFCSRPLSPRDARRIALYRRLFGPDSGRRHHRHCGKGRPQGRKKTSTPVNRRPEPPLKKQA